MIFCGRNGYSGRFSEDKLAFEAQGGLLRSKGGLLRKTPPERWTSKKDLPSRGGLLRKKGGLLRKLFLTVHLTFTIQALDT